MPGEQRQRSYRLTDEAVAGFDRLATRHRVTITALLEAFGRLATENPTIDDIVQLAWDIDRDRHSRRPRD